MSEEMRSQQIEQKQIEEMAKVIMGAVPVTIQYVQAPANETEARIEAKALIAAGYRKQSDVAKELINCILIDLIALRSEKLSDKSLGLNNKTYKCLVLRLKEIAAEYGVEVEK